MIYFQSADALFALPWHAVKSIRIVKRFPMQGERLGEFNTTPVYLLLVNDMVFGRYSSMSDAYTEFYDLTSAYSRNEPYCIYYSLSEDEYERMLSGDDGEAC